jgi:hypothetical protein
MIIPGGLSRQLACRRHELTNRTPSLSAKVIADFAIWYHSVVSQPAEANSIGKQIDRTSIDGAGDPETILDMRIHVAWAGFMRWVACNAA